VRPPRQLLREQLRYGVPLGLSLAVASLSLYVDQVIVSALLFPAAYAVYSVAWTPVRLFATVTSAVATTLVPVWSRALQEERLEEALRLSREAARRLSLLLIPGCCILSLAAPDLIRLLFSARYEASIPVFRVAVFVLPAQVFMADAFLSAMGRTGVLLGGSLGALVIESGFVALGIRLAGLPGAAVAAVTVNVLLRGCYGWAIRRRAGTEASALLPWSNLLRTTAVCATAAVPAGAAMLLFHPGVVRLGTGFAVYAIAYISLLVATRTATRADLELVRRWASVRFVVGGRRAPRTAL
jgi:O-antigen/teichoic acid export membrane protein